jgi:hypothetical protein
MDPTRRNLLAGSGVLLALGASPALAEQVTPTSKRKTPGRSKTDTTRDPFAQLAYQRAQQYPSIDYTDIRDYGTVTDGGDITAALQATINAIAAVNPQTRVRIPFVGDSAEYTCGAITWPAFALPWELQFDCNQITLTASWIFNINQSGIKLIGMRHATPNVVYPYGPVPRPIIQGPFGQTAIFMNGVNNWWIEGVQINGNGAIGLQANDGALVTVKHCVIGTNSNVSTGNLPAMKFDGIFWAQLENLYLEPGINAGPTPAGYSCEFVTDTPGTNNGIMICMNWIVTRQGVLFRANFGPVGVDNTELYRLHSENFADGAALCTFDSTNGFVGQIKILYPEMSDPTGTCHIIKNVGANTNGIYIQGISQEKLIDPTSTHGITNLVIDNSCTSATSAAMPISLGKQFASGVGWGNWTFKTPSWIDSKLGCAPVAPPWVPYTPLAVAQDPANWTTAGGGTVTTGKLAPDGSTMAGEVFAPGAGPSGARCYNANHTVALGDYIIAGVWIRNPNGGAVDSQQTGIELIGAGGSSFSGSGANGSLTANLEDDMLDNGWRWCSVAMKVINVGTNPCTVRFRLCAFGGGVTRQFFAPCMMLIPAATVANLDEVWLINLARSMKGGWSSTAVAGDVSVLDHQTFKAGVFKATAKTFAALPASPVAGMQAYITDCNTATWGATAAGGGLSKVMVWYNGSNWTVIGK